MYLGAGCARFSPRRMTEGQLLTNDGRSLDKAAPLYCNWELRPCTGVVLSDRLSLGVVRDLFFEFALSPALWRPAPGGSASPGGTARGIRRRMFDPSVQLDASRDLHRRSGFSHLGLCPRTKACGSCLSAIQGTRFARATEQHSLPGRAYWKES